MDTLRVLLVGGVVVVISLFGRTLLDMARAALRPGRVAPNRGLDDSDAARLARLEPPRAVERPVTPH